MKNKKYKKKKQKYDLYYGPFGWYAKRPRKWKYDTKKGTWVIQEVLENFLKRHEMFTPFREAMILKEMRSLLGVEFMTHMRPLSFSSGVLLCVVDSPIWNQQYTMMKGRIMERLNTGDHEWRVQDIRFKVGSFPGSQYLLKEEEKDSEFLSSIQKLPLSEDDTAFLDTCLDGMPSDLCLDVRGALETLLKMQKAKGAPNNAPEKQ